MNARDTTTAWWRHAVIYQVYPRSFADANGDGIGDLPGVLARIDDLAALGIDAIWFSPFYRSPQHDAGYDVADYRDIDPRFGTLADFDALREAMTERGLRCIVDLVPNHSSSEHPWFQAALAAGPGSPERARYIFRPGKGEHGELPPNNWRSVFGGEAWSRVTESDGTPGEWYLHLFDVTQPDFDWTNPEIADEFDAILRFWLDRGVDGFRVDVAHGNIKDTLLPDMDLSGIHNGSMAAPFFNQEGVHEIYRRWRHVLDEYDGERILVAEAWVEPLQQLARYVRPDEMHQAFNFSYLEAHWDAEQLRAVIDESIAEFAAVDAPSTWVLSNHDTVRHTTRLALVPKPPHGVGVGPRSESKADPAVAFARGRASTALMLALPGSAYLYQGDELGLPEVVDLPDEVRDDPSFFRSEGALWGRDGCRVPIPWEADAPAYGFSPTGATWLPQPAEWRTLARDQQRGHAGSTLELTTALLGLRRDFALGEGTLAWESAPTGVLQFRNGDVRVIANVSGEAVPVPAGDVLVATGPIDDVIPADTTVWLRA